MLGLVNFNGPFHFGAIRLCHHHGDHNGKLYWLWNQQRTSPTETPTKDSNFRGHYVITLLGNILDTLI